MTVTTPNGSLSTAGRLNRNRRIAEAREIEGLSWPVIAERFGLSDRHARRAFEEFRASVERGEVGEIDVEGAVTRVVRVHLTALARAEALIEEVGESNAGVGLLRVASAVGVALLDVLARTGHLPDVRDQVLSRQVQGELRSVAEDLVRAADDHGLPRAVIDRVVGETGQQTGFRRPEAGHSGDPDLSLRTWATASALPTTDSRPSRQLPRGSCASSRPPARSRRAPT